MTIIFNHYILGKVWASMTNFNKYIIIGLLMTINNCQQGRTADNHKRCHCQVYSDKLLLSSIDSKLDLCYSIMTIDYSYKISKNSI